MLSVLIPIYNEEEQIPLTLAALQDVLKDLAESYEILACDDGSFDRSWELLVRQQAVIPKLRLLRFSRNFGKEAAILALLEAARGDAVVLMDADLQHPPRYIPEMLKLWREGAEIVDGVKIARQTESRLKRWAARSFYRLFRRLSGLDLQNASDFKLLDRKAVRAYLACPEERPFFRALSAWIGFRRVALPFEVAERRLGKSKWSARQLFALSYEAFTSFSSAPLRLVPLLGLIFWLFALGLGIQTLVHWARGESAGGFPTVILLILITGGAIMLALGLIGSYLGRIYAEIKRRPRYILTETREATGEKGGEISADARRGAE